LKGASPKPVDAIPRLASNPMSNVQRIARNTTLLLLSNVAGFVLGFFFTMYVARYLAAEGFGVLSLALAFTAIFGVLTDIGLQTLMIREITRDKSLAQKYLSNIAVLKVVLGSVTFGLIALTAQLAHYPAETVRVIYLLGLSVILGAFSTMFYGLFRAYERMEFEALGGALGGALLLGGALYAISHHFSIAGFGWVYFVASIIMLAYCFVISAWKFTMPRIELDLSFCKETLKQAWPFALSGVFLTIYLWVDSVMLSSMKGNEAVGLYNAPYRLILILSFLPGAYFGAVFPIMSRFYITSKDFLRFTHERSLKYMLILGVPIGVGTTILAEKIILLIFGSDYYPSVIPLQILIWSTVFTFISGVFVNLFQSVNRQMILVWVLGSAAILKVVLNLALIPGHSYTGASIATLATSFVALALSLIWASRIGYGISIRNTIYIIIRVLVASAVIAVFLLYLKYFYILAVIPLAALLYFGVLYIIGGIDKEDRLLLQQIIGQRLPT
jgi:O-antigen/teichoic acid export membrane protein